MDKKIHPHDFIHISPKTKARIYKICGPLYQKGLSLRDIETRTGIPKTTIHESLQENGMALRNSAMTNQLKNNNQKFKCGGQAPYGFTYLDGQLVIDPKEHLICRKIFQLQQSGKSNQHIADELNHQNIPTRLKGTWQKSVINSIIKRHQEIKNSQQKNIQRKIS